MSMKPIDTAMPSNLSRLLDAPLSILAANIGCEIFSGLVALAFLALVLS